MVNTPLIRPYFRGGYVRGGRLTGHNDSELAGVVHIPKFGE